jgi:GNAT superfamily N-acetyltransferase
MESWTIRPCGRDEWPVFAAHVRAMWQDIGASPDQIKPNWLEEVLRFLECASETGGFRGYVAVCDGQIVGSAGGQLFAGLSPALLEPDYRQMGYVWGVYVRPEQRGRGIASALTQALTEYLFSVGCSQVRLHASSAGQPVYEKLGFEPSTEMRLMRPG